MPKPKDADAVHRNGPTAFAAPQQDAALRYATDAERSLRKLRKAIKKGKIDNSTEWLSALQSDAARVATVLAFLEPPRSQEYPAPPKPPTNPLAEQIRQRPSAG